MALSPFTTAAERVNVVEPVVQPSKTYRLDLDSGEIGGVIDGEDAARQFIRKALVTQRFRNLIYDRTYGSELESLIEQQTTPELREMEVIRTITEALIYDERVADVRDFEITRDDGSDELFVSFFVELADGNTISEGVTV